MQIAVLLVSGVIIMTVLTETMGMGLIMTAAHCDMQLTPTRKGVISSVSFIGKKLNKCGHLNDEIKVFLFLL